MERRTFLALPLTLIGPPEGGHYVLPLRLSAQGARIDIAQVERRRVLGLADRYLRESPITITNFRNPRSAGGLHDYSSDADYWWPDPENPKGPYIQRDGMTNPGNFVAHRHAMIRLSLQVPALAAAWKLTRERRYADHAARHLRAWFLDPETLLNPHLLYSQAIQGRVTGRGIGIIDTLHLVEVIRAISNLEDSVALSARERDGVRDWFARYVSWMTTHQYGIDERETTNNHATCWVMQVAEFARHTGNDTPSDFCRERYKTALLNQMAEDGSFPRELARTKPYGYSLFNLDALTGVCQILSAPTDNLWTYENPYGRGVRKGLEFMFPYIVDTTRWPHPPDVMYVDGWPVRHHSLLFGGLALNRPDYIAAWRKLDPDPTVDEIVRNYFVRQPVLWVQ